MTYAIQFLLQPDRNAYRVIEKRFHMMCTLHNTVVKHGLKCLRILKRCDEYNRIQSAYRGENDEKERKRLSAELKGFHKNVGLTKTDFEKYAKVIGGKYRNHLASQQVQKEADRVWDGVERILWKSAKKLHFKKESSFYSISQKCRTNGIKFNVQKKQIMWNGLCIPVKINRNDPYVDEALLDEIRYCEIKRMLFTSGYRYYLTVVLSGSPPKKINYSDRKNSRGGIDFGTSSIAYVSDTKIILRELAPNALKYEQRIGDIQRRIDHLIRNNNPDRYTADGQPKKIKGKWRLSRNTIRLMRQRDVLYRKRAAYIRQMHFIMANEVIRDCRVLYAEPMDYKSLKTRSKSAEHYWEDRIKQETKNKGELCKCRYKKRFGHSMINRAPSAFVTILKNKSDAYGVMYKEIDSRRYKASQFDHTTGEYKPAPLNQRSKEIGGQVIQRDLLSAWYIRNSVEDLTHPDQQLCDGTFEDFVQMHDEEIERMKEAGITFKSVFGF